MSVLRPEKVTRPLAVALLAGAGLFLEVAVTRLFSTLFYPPAVYAVLSLAVLGIGMGAAIASWRSSARRESLAPQYMALASISALLLVIAASIFAAIEPPLHLILLVIAPFSCLGLAVVTLFSNAADDSPRLYRADLLGAGLGTILAVVGLDLLAAPNAVIVAALVFSLAALITAAAGDARLPIAATFLSLLLLIANLASDRLSLDMASLPADKPIEESLADGGRIIMTKWDAFARTDLVAPDDAGPYRLYVDGAAASLMPPAEENDFLWRDVGLFPFATARPERVFIIGPGGGLDVWFGLQSQAAEIVAVEVNSAAVETVEAMAEYNGDLYAQAPVRLVVDEGRSVLRREDQLFDLIFLSQVVTLAAERGGYALVENSAYTVEAFEEYFDHLTADGQIALKLYDEPTLTRALSTVMAVLRDRGMSDVEALNHVIALLDTAGNPAVPLLIVQNSPFSRDDALALGAVARDVGFTPLFLPRLLASQPLDAVAAGQLSFSEVVSRSEIDISPSTDDRPFFFQFERGIPDGLRPLVWGLAAVAVVGTILLLFSQREVRPLTLRWSPLHFAALGLGFIAVEVALIQQTRLFLGHPTLGVTTVLATLFIAGGLGSGLAGRLVANSDSRLVAWPSGAVALTALIWTAFWPQLNGNFLASEQLVRVIIVVLSLLPLAFLMGMPFPLALRAVGRASDRHLALGWAVNGFMTVIGSAAAVTLAILAGFTWVVILAAVAYGIAALSAFILSRADVGEVGIPLLLEREKDPGYPSQ
jgi:hypothetical protein